jgi:hypothetical protein
MRGMVVSVLLAIASAAQAAGDVDFHRDVQPILSDKCFRCHGPDEKARKAKLRFDTKEGAFRVKDGEAVIKPGKSAESELYQRISSPDEDEVMPPPKAHLKLSPGEIETLKQWIDQGAPWGELWSFQKPIEPPVPQLQRFAQRVKNPIDSFVFAKLERQNLSPSPEAPKASLLRRVTLDLTGLPPTPDEVNAFLNDPSSDAYEKVVDRLLASPAFGQRMAWDWLDAAHYADTNGYQGDSERTMWPWRDWVVKAFNDNMPYDRFTLWQLAGDLLPNATPSQKLATGFCRNHMINGEGGRIAEENRIEYIFDQLETVGTVWLGLTMNCTRCHDHKFDPLTRRDYYGLFAFFNQTPVDGGGGDPQAKPNLELPTPEQKEKLEKLDDQIKAASKLVSESEQSLSKSFAKPTEKRKKEELAELEKSTGDYGKRVKDLRVLIEQRDALSRSIPRVMVMQDMPKPRKTFMLEKGLYDKVGEEVTAAVPAKLPPLTRGVPANRLGLAQWIISPENPLTARVTVNRLWQQFFGIGLVKTAEDFGNQGEVPPQRELLDYLACEFQQGGWNVKSLVRLIVTSAVYRQSSKVTPEMAERDPENRLLARGPRFRMPSWMLRDQALAAGGLLVPALGGPGVKSYQPAGIWEEATFGAKRYAQDHGDSLYRRSLYIFWRRIIGPTIFFDTASRQTCTVKQTRTNTPLQALLTLDDVTYVEAARAMAQRALLQPGLSDQDRAAFAFRLLLAREPTPEESKLLLRSLQRLRHEFSADPAAAKKLLAVGESKRDQKLDPLEHAAWTGLCTILLNLDETLTKE